MQALPVVGSVELAPQGCFKKEVQRLTSVVAFLSCPLALLTRGLGRALRHSKIWPGCEELDDEEGVCHHENVLLIQDALLHAFPAAANIPARITPCKLRELRFQPILTM